MRSPASPDANSSDDTGRLLRFDERFVSGVWKQFDRDGMPTFTRQILAGDLYSYCAQSSPQLATLTFLWL